MLAVSMQSRNANDGRFNVDPRKYQAYSLVTGRIFLPPGPFQWFDMSADEHTSKSSLVQQRINKVKRRWVERHCIFLAQTPVLLGLGRWSQNVQIRMKAGSVPCRLGRLCVNEC